MKVAFGMTAYNRPRLLKETLPALLESIGGRYPLRIVLDLHKTQERQYEFISQFMREHHIEVFISNQRLGCAGAHKRLFEWAFEDHDADAFVLVEDDGLVAPDFCDVMVEMLERFKDDEEVFSTTAWFSHQTTTEQPDATALIKRKHFTCHTFGTWRRVWDDIQAAGGVRGVHWLSSKQTPEEGEQMADLLRWDKDDGSWAIPFNHVYRGDRYEVATLLPRMKDIGTMGTFMRPHLHEQIMRTPFWSKDLETVPSVDELRIETDTI